MYMSYSLLTPYNLYYKRGNARYACFKNWNIRILDKVNQLTDRNNFDFKSSYLQEEPNNISKLEHIALFAQHGIHTTIPL